MHSTLNENRGISNSGVDPRRVLPLAEVERIHIQHVMSHPLVDGRRDLAADLLGIGRTTLYRKLKQYKQAQKLQ